jgi:hypothetical protein
MLEDTGDVPERFAEDRAWVKIAARIAVNTPSLAPAAPLMLWFWMVCRNLGGSRREQL